MSTGWNRKSYCISIILFYRIIVSLTSDDSVYSAFAAAFASCRADRQSAPPGISSRDRSTVPLAPLSRHPAKLTARERLLVSASRPHHRRLDPAYPTILYNRFRARHWGWNRNKEVERYWRSASRPWSAPRQKSLSERRLSMRFNTRVVYS